ncbi:hypothetical protein CHS0354_040284 [Potamilus streckersoni]|uniref:Uncharacterized protein n=1 Tax=Potamilus streckersoni TaxID=2493646 RepID=A0AAE0VPN8_9BIVA|nr:hypothetical protein CHS0354_040284 [Potamilus streckersoni]
MATWKEYLAFEGYKTFEEARKLSEELSKTDPEDEPYKSLYKARELLVTIREKLGSFSEDNEVLKFLCAALELAIELNKNGASKKGVTFLYSPVRRGNLSVKLYNEA